MQTNKIANDRLDTLDIVELERIKAECRNQAAIRVIQHEIDRRVARNEHNLARLAAFTASLRGA